MVQDFKKKYNLFIIVYIIIVVLLVSFSFFQGLLKGGYYPVYEDEMIYYNSAKLFMETNSTKAFTCINEQRSAVGEYNWYGPSYHIIYGGIAKLFGFNQNMFIVFNYILFILTISISFLINTTLRNKLLFTAILISSYSAFTYLFSYFPESLQIFLTIILLVLYSRIDVSKKYYYAFIGLVLLFSLIRYSTVFWIFSILFNENIKQTLRVRIILSFLVFSLVIIWFKFFTAPAYVVGLKDVHGSVNMGIIGIIKSAIINGYKNYILFFNKGNFQMISVLLIFIVVSYNFIIKKIINNLSIFGLFIICVLAFLVFIFFYTALPVYFEKQTMFIFPILIYCLIKTEYNLKLLLMISIFLFFPFSWFKMEENKNLRIISKISLKNNIKLEKDLEGIFNGIHVKKNKVEINVFLQYNDFSELFINYLGSLPVSKGKTPVLYTVNLNEKIKFYNKIKLDFIISKHYLKNKRARLIKKGDYYYLYKVI
jgi:hypothetical protein